MYFHRVVFSFLILSLVLGSGHYAQSQQPNNQPLWEALARPDELKDRIIFEMIMDTCTRMSPTVGFKMIWQSTKHVLNVTVGFRVEEAKGLVKNYGLSPELGLVLNSPAYHRALHFCYNTDGVAKALFTGNLIVADIGGKAVGALGTIGFYSSGYWILKYLRSVAPRASRLLTAAGVFAIIGSLHSAWKKRKEDKKNLSAIDGLSVSAEKQKQAQKEELKKTIDLLYATLRIDTLTPQERQDIQLQIDKLTKQITIG